MKRAEMTIWLIMALAFTGFVGAGTYSGGTGQAADPYKITIAADWQELMNTPMDWNKHFLLTAHLNLESVPLTPVGNYDDEFTGVFDGGGFTISNAVISQLGESYAGLFGYTAYPAEIFNLGIINSSVSGWHWVGGLVGRNDGGRLSRIFWDGSVNATGNYVGGIVGAHSSFAALSNSFSFGSISGSNYVGGVAGYNGGNAEIQLSYANAEINGIEYVGGLVGWNSTHSTIEMCYAAGSVTGMTDVGGLVGKNDGAMVAASFWDTEKSGQTASDGGVGKTSLQMKLRSTFTDAGWDFINVWEIGQFQTYPYLRTRPAADITADNIINLEDFAILAAQWLTIQPRLPDPPGPDGMVWIYVDDDGSGMRDSANQPINEGGFTGYMSKYLTTNAQYCQFLNAALEAGIITIDGNYVKANGGPFSGEPYYRLDGQGGMGAGSVNGGKSRISISLTSGLFTVESGFEYFPVTYVSWYGATAFAAFYGWRLPTEWEWQAVADYDGSYRYATGESLYTDTKFLANYRANGCNEIPPNDLPYHPYAEYGVTPVGYFGSFGYGLADMAGNTWEMTSSQHPDENHRTVRGGSWVNDAAAAPVWNRGYGTLEYMGLGTGFRVCR